MAASDEAIWGGVDAGGATFKCRVVNTEGRLLYTARFATGSEPDGALSRCADFFSDAERTFAALVDTPAFGDNAGLKGGVLLALDASATPHEKN